MIDVAHPLLLVSHVMEISNESVCLPPNEFFWKSGGRCESRGALALYSEDDKNKKSPPQSL